MRADGKRLKHIDPMYKLMPYFMTKRSDAMNMTTVDIPYEPMKRYINDKRNQGEAVSHMALIIAAYMRTVAEYPELNRFIMNKKIYSRNEYTVSMVVLTPGGSAESTESKMYFQPTDTIFDVNKKINDYIDENRNSPQNNSTEKIMKILLSVPGLVNVGLAVIKLLDRYGLLPKAVIDASPFHNSLLISNLMSIRTNHIYHHIYDFGNTGIAITIGTLREVPKRKGDEVVFERSLPLGVVMDERICSGLHFSQAIRTMKRYLKNPVLLESPPETVKQDPGL